MIDSVSLTANPITAVPAAISLLRQPFVCDKIDLLGKRTKEQIVIFLQYNIFVLHSGFYGGCDRVNIQYLDNASEIRKVFLHRFVLSWETFQGKNKKWIEKRSKMGYPVTKQWYDQSFLWDKMDPGQHSVSMKEALTILRERAGKVMFMTEAGRRLFSDDDMSVGAIAQTDARELADRIEKDWYDSYRLVAETRYLPNEIAKDLYVFDPSLTWYAIFTHETTDAEAELNEDTEKTAESRYCMVCAPVDGK